MVVPFELEELCSSRVCAGQTQGEHRGFTAAVGETNRISGWHHPAKVLRRFHLRWSGGRKMRALGDSLRNYIDNVWMRMPVDERAKRHHEIDVLVSVEIPDVRSAAALEHDRSRRVNGDTARWRGLRLQSAIAARADAIHASARVCRSWLRLSL